ncbi:MAG TPA: OsmC family peroxiredoxin [Solirubrobacteraceae bacterium]|nr:OsmC family peroxiredoxin [Solirubrobacteraceae bacterium]
MSFRVIRRAQASWQGTVPAGGGRLSVGSGAYEGPFSLRARTEAVEQATNPEELIGAALAGCFTMSLANLLGEAGHPPADLQTTAEVRLEQLEGRFTISVIELSTVGQVPGVDSERFGALASEAKNTCTVSRALAGTEIRVTASLLD